MFGSQRFGSAYFAGEVQGTAVAPPFISSATVVHAPTLSGSGIAFGITATFGAPAFGWAYFGEGSRGAPPVPQDLVAPFISSVSAVYTPALVAALELPFIGSATVVYTPNLVADISAPFIPSVTVVYTPTMSPGQIFAPFISSTTLVHAPTLVSLGFVAPFISSLTVVYTPSLQGTFIDVPFLSSNTVVYPPTLRVAFTGGGVSQVALEVITTDGLPNAQVTQVTLEIIVPMYKGLHVWQRT